VLLGDNPIRTGVVEAEVGQPAQVECGGSVVEPVATSIHGSQHRACGNYSRAYESSLTCEIALADKAPLSARKGMGIDASESSDSVASLGSGRDNK
jgi:hypothetical protein